MDDQRDEMNKLEENVKDKDEAIGVCIAILMANSIHS